MKSIFNSVSNRITDKIWTKPDSAGLLSQKKILNVGSVLQSVTQHSSNSEGQIEVPMVVVVGGQSSGKSSLLNGILSYDLLPTGTDITTRLPLHMELIPSKQDTTAEFGNYDSSGLWQSIKNINFQLPVPTKMQRDAIRKQIVAQTDKIAGNDSNVSKKPIHLRIYAPDIPNLTLVDLPGMTSVARTDLGQPEDIELQIKNMIASYISRPKTIILAVLPARTDIEADMAMGLIKKYDPNYDRTIGVLTKVDLMNINTDVCNYLTGNVSKSLQLKYGYFAVRNRTTQEAKQLTVIEGFNKEREFFQSHPAYGSLKDTDTLRLGIPNMASSIGNILVHNIKESLPFILNQVNTRLVELDKEYNSLGSPLPETDDAKTAFAHSLLTNFSRTLCNSLNNRGSSYDTGRCIRELFIKYRKDIKTENPFNKISNNKDLIELTIRNSTGNHMTSPIPPIEVLEQCLKDDKSRPIAKLYTTSNECLKDICEQIFKLIDDLLNRGQITRFPNLITQIKVELNGTHIVDCLNNTKTSITTLIAREENYIWTDNEHFHQLLGNINTQPTSVSMAPNVTQNNGSENVNNTKNGSEHNNGLFSFIQSSQNRFNNNIQSQPQSHSHSQPQYSFKSISTDPVKRMNELLKAYYETYIETMANDVPKIIMYEFINKIQDSLMSNFNENILCLPIEELLKENGERATKRESITQERKRLRHIKKLIQDI